MSGVVAAKLRAAVTEIDAGEYHEMTAILSELRHDELDRAIEIVLIVLEKLRRLRQIHAAGTELISVSHGDRP